LTRNF